MGDKDRYGKNFPRIEGDDLSVVIPTLRWGITYRKLLIIKLSTDVTQAATVNTVSLAIHRADQLFASQFFENGERAVAE